MDIIEQMKQEFDKFIKKCEMMLENPIILKEGHLYITRDGRKAFIASIDNGDGIARGCIEVWSKICEWDLDGKCLDNAGKAENVDIVEEFTLYKAKEEQ